MGKANYKDIREVLIPDLKEFQGNTLRAVMEYAPNKSGEWQRAYVIYSYRTIIAKYFYDGNYWMLNVAKYSPTTSKQQTYVRYGVGLQGGLVINY